MKGKTLNILLVLGLFSHLNAEPILPSPTTIKEIHFQLSNEDFNRYENIYNHVHDVKRTLIPTDLSQNEIDILALQTCLSYRNTGPEIAQKLRQTAIQLWKKFSCKNTLPVQMAGLKMLTYGLRPNDGYAIHFFERDYLFHLKPNEINQAKKELLTALNVFWPLITVQLEKEWLKQLPQYDQIDAIGYEAGLDHTTTLDIYTALMGHQIYGWITSGFGEEEATFAKINFPHSFEIPLPFPNQPNRLDKLKILYFETTQLEKNWHFRINDRNFYSFQPSYMPVSEIQHYQADAFKVAEAFRHLPSDIRPEIVVMSANKYIEGLPQTLSSMEKFIPHTDRSLHGLTERLFNQELLAEQRRFIGIGLGRQFYDQLNQIAANLGIVSTINSDEISGFRWAYVPEPEALEHAHVIRHDPELARLIEKHEGIPTNELPAERLISWMHANCNRDWTKSSVETLSRLANSTNRKLLQQKAVVNRLADLSKYLYVIDQTLLTLNYHPSYLLNLRLNLLLLSFHPKAEEINFDVNHEFKASLEKLFSYPVLSDLQIALLDDHVNRLSLLADKHLSAEPDLNAHSAIYREKFVKEVWPTLSPSFILELPHLDSSNPYLKSYSSIRQFLGDGQRVFRRLQQLEIEVMLKAKGAGQTPESILQQILYQWELVNEFNSSIEELNKGFSAEQWYALLKKSSLFHDVTFVAQPHGIDSHRLQWNLIMREMKDNPKLFGYNEKGQISAGDLYRELSNEELMKQLGYPYGDRESVWRDLFDVLHISNFSTTDCLTRVVRDYVPGLGNIEIYKN